MDDDDLPLDETDFLEVRIENLSLSNVGFIVFLKEADDGRILPIVIGPTEAQSIVAAYNNQGVPRPLTHDLMKNVLETLGCELVKIYVTSLQENTFYARIFLRREDGEEIDVDSRPSDAIALAIRYQAPMFVHRDVLQSAGIPSPPDEGGEPVAPEAPEPEAEAEEEAEPEVEEEPREPSPAPEPRDPVERIKGRLEKAVQDERYEDAARLRDELDRLQHGA